MIPMNSNSRSPRVLLAVTPADLQHDNISTVGVLRMTFSVLKLKLHKLTINMERGCEKGISSM